MKDNERDNFVTYLCHFFAVIGNFLLECSFQILMLSFVILHFPCFGEVVKLFHVMPLQMCNKVACVKIGKTH